MKSSQPALTPMGFETWDLRDFSPSWRALTSSNMVPAGTGSLYARERGERDGTVGALDEVGEGDDGCERDGDLERWSSAKGRGGRKVPLRSRGCG